MQIHFKENLLQYIVIVITSALLIGGIYHYYDIAIAICKHFGL